MSKFTKKCTPGSKNEAGVTKEEQLKSEVNEVINLSKKPLTEEKSTEEKIPLNSPPLVRDSYRAIQQTWGKLLVETESICYLKAQRSYCEIYLPEGNPILVCVPMSKASASLPTEHFIRIHKGHIINLKYVKQIKKNCFVLKNGKKLSIGSTYRDEICNSLRIIGSKSKKHNHG